MRPPGSIGGAPAAGAPTTTGALAALPAEDQPEVGQRKELPPHLKRQEVYYETKEPAGTIVVDTSNTHLYFVLGGNRAMRYGVRVGRDGFTWAGVQKVTKKAEWPDWHPPTEMIERQPYLPRFMAGGEGNPLGARAMYLGNTVYRIHGTNQPSTIGQFVSSGCVGMLNEDVSDLFERVKVGTRVVVLPGGKPPAVASADPTNLAPPGQQPGYASPQGAQPPGPQPIYRGDTRSDATTVQPLPPPTTIR
jgi:lipoprotein-anchoring transpeptidase ErfK/SrfK